MTAEVLVVDLVVSFLSDEISAETSAAPLRLLALWLVEAASAAFVKALLLPWPAKEEL